MTEERLSNPEANPFLRAVTAAHNELVAQRDGVLAELQHLSGGAVDAMVLYESVKQKLDTLTELDLKISVIVKYFKSASNEKGEPQENT